MQLDNSLLKSSSIKRLAGAGPNSETTSKKTSQKQDGPAQSQVPKRPANWPRFAVERFLVELTRHRRTERMFEAIVSVVLSLVALGIIVLAVCSALSFVAKGQVCY